MFVYIALNILFVFSIPLYSSDSQDNPKHYCYTGWSTEQKAAIESKVEQFKLKKSHPAVLAAYLALCALENQTLDAQPIPLLDTASMLIKKMHNAATTKFFSGIFTQKTAVEMESIEIYLHIKRHLIENNPLEAFEQLKKIYACGTNEIRNAVHKKITPQFKELFTEKNDTKSLCELAHAITCAMSGLPKKEAYKDLKRLQNQYPQAIYYIAASQLHTSPFEQIVLWAQFFQVFKNPLLQDFEQLSELNIPEKLCALSVKPDRKVAFPYKIIHDALVFEQEYFKAKNSKREKLQNLRANVLAPLMQTATFDLQKSTTVADGQRDQRTIELFAAVSRNITILAGYGEIHLKDHEIAGTRVPKNLLKAFEFFRVGAAYDNPIALICLAHFYSQGYPGITSIDIEKADALAERATKEKRSAHAAALCARYYLSRNNSARAYQFVWEAISTMPPHLPGFVCEDAFCFLSLAAFNLNGTCKASDFKNDKKYVSIFSAAGNLALYLKYVSTEEVIFNHLEPGTSFLLIIKKLTKLIDKNGDNRSKAQIKLNNLHELLRDRHSLKMKFINIKDEEGREKKELLIVPLNADFDSLQSRIKGPRGESLTLNIGTDHDKEISGITTTDSITTTSSS